MTDILSWTAWVKTFGIVVSIDQPLIQFPLGSYQRSHNPANANSFPWKKVSRLAFGRGTPKMQQDGLRAPLRHNGKPYSGINVAAAIWMNFKQARMHSLERQQDPARL
jgi:hypothetical protein